jgi:hypothetical protein
MNIKGGVAHSALGITEIKTRISGSQMIIEARLGLARKGVEGRLDFNVEIPSSLEEVLFGSKLERIWKR